MKLLVLRVLLMILFLLFMMIWKHTWAFYLFVSTRIGPFQIVWVLYFLFLPWSYYLLPCYCLSFFFLEQMSFYKVILVSIYMLTDFNMKYVAFNIVSSHLLFCFWTGIWLWDCPWKFQQLWTVISYSYCFDTFEPVNYNILNFVIYRTMFCNDG